MKLTKLLPKSSLLRTILFILLFPLFIISIILFYKNNVYLISSNKKYNIPSDWKDYRNEDFSFQLKYPDNWTIRENKYSKYGENFSGILIYPIPLDNMDKEYINYVNSGGYPLEALDISIGDVLHTESALNKTGISEMGLFGAKSGKLIFNDLKARKTYTTMTDFGRGETTIEFNYGNYGWTLKFPNTNLRGDHDKVYDQLLSSIEFD